MFGSGGGAGVFFGLRQGGAVFFRRRKVQTSAPLPVNSEPSVIRPGGEGTLNLRHLNFIVPPV